MDLKSNRKIILQLAKKDIQSKYLGSYLGILWAFVNPLVTIAVYWFIFQVGFKSVPVDKFPFILWFMAGIVPWFFFSDAISTATYSVIDNSYLVKKVIFPINLLVLVKIISALFVHIFFILVLFIMFFVYGYHLNWYNVQFIYYTFCTIMLLAGFSWITSALVVFLKDVGQIVNMFLQLFFWITPIFWTLKMLPTKYDAIFKLNPLFYIVEGYRDAFVYHKWFWEHTTLTPYFWIVTISSFVIGITLFNRLRPHFADIL